MSHTDNIVPSGSQITQNSMDIQIVYASLIAPVSEIIHGHDMYAMMKHLFLAHMQERTDIDTLKVI